MNKVNTNVSLDANLKKLSTRIFAELGLDFSTAINMFLKQAINHKGLPFDVCLEEPNDVTLDAMDEINEMKSNTKKYKRYSSVKEYFKDIGIN